MSGFTILVTGGARSGKSRYSLESAEKFPGKKYFLATAQPLDDEMRKRIKIHRAQRDGRWQTIEEPIEIARVVSELNMPDNVVLIDCLNLWVSNTLDETEERFGAMVDETVSAIGGFAGTLVMVTNEVGLGIVPAHPKTRIFRDRLGFLNQAVAQKCRQVVMMVSGIPLYIKGSSE